MGAGVILPLFTRYFTQVGLLAGSFHPNLNLSEGQEALR